MSKQKSAPSALGVADGSAVWVVVQYDQCDWTEFIMDPGYWSRAHAQTRARRLNERETDSYSYQVKEIKMHPLPNASTQPRDYDAK